MKLPNRISFSRIVIALIICIILLFPFDSAGLTTLKIFVNESIVVDIKYIIVGVLFVIASLTDIFDGYIGCGVRITQPCTYMNPKTPFD